MWTEPRLLSDRVYTWGCSFSMAPLMYRIASRQVMGTNSRHTLWHRVPGCPLLPLLPSQFWLLALLLGHTCPIYANAQYLVCCSENRGGGGKRHPWEPITELPASGLGIPEWAAPSSQPVSRCSVTSSLWCWRFSRLWRQHRCCSFVAT